MAKSSATKSRKLKIIQLWRQRSLHLQLLIVALCTVFVYFNFDSATIGIGHTLTYSVLNRPTDMAKSSATKSRKLKIIQLWRQRSLQLQLLIVALCTVFVYFNFDSATSGRYSDTILLGQLHIINYDSPRGGVSVVTNKGETTTSFLLIKTARPSDSGQYQCNPSNSKSKGVTVHVLHGEFPAAMQRAGKAHHQMSPNHYLLVYLSTFLSTIVFIRRYQKIPNVASHF